LGGRAYKLRWASFLLPLAAILVFALMRYQAPRFAAVLTQHADGLIYLRAALFGLSGVVAIVAGIRLGRNRLRLHRAVYLLLGLALVVVAMDTIRWGQALFGFEAPAWLSAPGSPGVIALHELAPVAAMLSPAGLVIGAWGAFGWLLRAPFDPPPRSLWRFIIPEWYQSSWFAVVLVVHLATAWAGQTGAVADVIVQGDRAIAWLSLAVGVLIFFAAGYRRAGSDPVRRQIAGAGPV
jgi:hypothetical protein